MKIAVVAAFKKEVAALIRATSLPALVPGPSPALDLARRLLHRRPRGPRLLWTEGEHAGIRLMIAATGMGPPAAAAAAKIIVARFRPDRVILCGTAGSLATAVEPLDLVIGDKVANAAACGAGAVWISMDPAMTETLAKCCERALPEARAHRGAVCSVARPVLAEAERAALHERLGAMAVDMEAAAVGAAARRAAVPAALVKVVTDRAGSNGAEEFRRHVDAAAELLARVISRYLTEGAAR